MTERASFLRKIAYGIAIAVLAICMMWLSAPASITKEGAYKEGGKLAELRRQYKLAQVNLGEVDPASETIKLATVGLRGVAVNLLWEKANYYKKVEDWTNLTATLEQLAKLQPNFITFWKFQAWNLTYNVSVEFDDYHDRYYYVRRGIEFLKEGEDYNKDHPSLLWDLGWFIGQKIGRADEYVQYRRLFKTDDYDYRPPGSALEERDNWLTGKEWYQRAIDAVDKKGKSLGRKSPRDFYSSPAKSQMNHAEAIEEEGFFEKARRAWIAAADEWRQFGNVFIEHSTGVKLQLGSQSRLEKELAEMRARLDAMLPDVRKKLAEEKRQALTSEERQLLDTPPEKLTSEQSQRVYEIKQKLEVTDRDVATRIARDHPEQDKQALQLASEMERRDTQLRYTINYKRDANYDYWQNRADFEQTADALAARELMFRARKAREEANVVEARKLYEDGFRKWRAVIDKFPSILDEEATTSDDLIDYIKRYRGVLEQFEDTLGEDFPLWDVIEHHDREQNFTEELKAHNKRKESNKPADKSAKPEAEKKEPEKKEPPAKSGEASKKQGDTSAK